MREMKGQPFRARAVEVPFRSSRLCGTEDVPFGASDSAAVRTLLSGSFPIPAVRFPEPCNPTSGHSANEPSAVLLRYRLLRSLIPAPGVT